MKKKEITDFKGFKDKTVLVRVDFNVPIINNEIKSDKRIKAALPTINYLLERNAKVVLFSHLGRIKSEEDKKTGSLAIVADYLKKLINYEVKFVAQTRGKELEDAINNSPQSSIIFVENTRFEDVENGKIVNKESKNDHELGKYWASLGDIFINDAFGTAHRMHASNVGIASHIEISAMGFLVKKEMEFLSEAIENPKRPFIALLGGGKVSDKLNVIKSLLEKADKVVIGTAMCYTFYLAMGKKIGNSMAEPSKVEMVKELMEKYKDKLIIAKDSVASPKFEDIKGEIVEEIPNGMIGMDIGPKTIKEVKEILKDAKTVIWNGPFGVTEFKNYEHGSYEIAKTLANMKEATTIIGGGDSASMVENAGLSSKFSYISTGGGASMALLEGKVLPGIKVIQNK